MIIFVENMKNIFIENLIEFGFCFFRKQ